MSDPFFAGASKKRRRTEDSSKKSGRGGMRAARRSAQKSDKVKGKEPRVGESDASDDESIAESEVEGGEDMKDMGDEEESLETPAQKRLRLAEQYLQSLKDAREEQVDEFDAADLDRDTIEERLQKDVLAESGKVHVFISKRISMSPFERTWTPPRAHRQSVTSSVLSPSGKYLYTATKDGYVCKWDISGVRPVRVAFQRRHTGGVFSLSINGAGDRLASGGGDKLVGIWDVRDSGLVWVQTLKGHRDKVGAVAFRRGTSQLFTSSFDRTVKIYDASSCAYIETLFGHQDSINDLSCLHGDAAISAGARDRTVRFWKVADETQLVFRSGGVTKLRQAVEGGDLTKGESGSREYLEGSTDCVAMVDDTHFLSGGDSGTLSLWSVSKKKAVFSEYLAHGSDPPAEGDQGSVATPRWITALACLPYGDVFASASWNGEIRLWSLSPHVNSFSSLTTIPAKGFVNSIQLVIAPKSPQDEANFSGIQDAAGDQLLVIASLGQEHRLGRWARFKSTQNTALIAKVQLSSES